MGFRSSIKNVKEAPKQAINIAIVALLIAITALVVSVGKKANA